MVNPISVFLNFQREVELKKVLFTKKHVYQKRHPRIFAWLIAHKLGSYFARYELEALFKEVAFAFKQIGLK